MLILGLALVASTTHVHAQSSGSEKLAYVAGIGPERTFFCEAIPQSGATNKTLMVLDFELGGAGVMTAEMVVTGSVNGRFYNTRIGWRGMASTDGDEARIVLNEVSSVDADALPGTAQWSDPEGDVITLRVDPYASLGSQSFVLQGTQETELGTNNLSCLDGPRR